MQILCCIRRVFLYILVTLLILGVPNKNSFAQSATGGWLMYFGDSPIDDKWSIYSEVQIRDYFHQQLNNQLLIRTGARYLIDDIHSVRMGYAYVHTAEPLSKGLDAVELREHRIWQEYYQRHARKIFVHNHRLRLEQRMQQFETMNGLDQSFSWRLRYRLGLKVPLSNILPIASRSFLFGYNEVFIIPSSELNFFDRNRVYFAFGYQFNAEMSIQLGFLRQQIHMPDRELKHLNSAQIGVFYNLYRIIKE
ncbi:MAG: DUF2490 domain-containing protein [Cyclobacteriaceae bacterium]|nr:DUF2490 domain-containing protein [Cyclobacteriaceae bacterium]MCH8515540.1 DUF2490 domain-containing protein [Cyclobacteriaceae bacterium]